MDALDFSTFFALDIAVRKNIDVFLKANDVKDYRDLRNLLIVEYLLFKRGNCYDYDLAYMLETKNNNPHSQYARKHFAKLRKQRFITFITTDYNDQLRRSVEITNKGLSVLDNYRTFFTRTEKDVMYQLKKVHSEALKNK